MNFKHKGTCPFCSEIVQPNVVEENSVRRDKCQCPSCQELVYVCRSPGCQNYAKGGKMYDDELCPNCTSAIAEVGKGAITTAVIGLVSAALTKGRK